MKLHGVIDIRTQGEPVLRDPGLWDRIKKAFGAIPDLRTDRMRTTIEAATLVEAARQMLSRFDANNAISLIIDKQVLFEDKSGRPDDLPDLMFAFRDHAAVFGSGFDLLRLVVEHEEAGLHMVIEVMARGEHPAAEAAARVIVGGRIRDFEPRVGESAEAYRRRVEPLMKDQAVFEIHRTQFESFVSRLADALRGALPDAEISIREAEAKVEKPGRTERPHQSSPTDLRYDPYDMYYPSPFPGIFSMMMWGSMLSWASVPHYTIVNHTGEEVGTTDAVSPEAMDAAAHGEDFQTGSEGGDVGDAGMDSMDAGFDSGDAGDFGGFDFGDW